MCGTFVILSQTTKEPAQTTKAVPQPTKEHSQTTKAVPQPTKEHTQTTKAATQPTKEHSKTTKRHKKTALPTRAVQQFIHKPELASQTILFSLHNGLKS